MLKYIYSSLAWMMVLVSCNPGSKEPANDPSVNTIRLTGTVKYPQSQGLVILQRLNGVILENIDTLTLDQNGKFATKLPVPEASFYRLDFYQQQWSDFILNDHDVVVNVDGNNRRGAMEVIGSPDTDLFKELAIMAQDMRSSIKDINMSFIKAKRAGDDQKASQVQEQFEQLSDQYRQKFKMQIDAMGTSIAAIFALDYLRDNQLFDFDEEFVFVDSINQKFQNAGIQNTNYLKFANGVEILRKLAMGMDAPEIALPDPLGNVINLSSLKGNYVLIDFWAAWCKPCRVENPNVVRLYKKYHTKGFEIYGVSLDRTKEAWVGAIEKDGLVWKHVSDLKFWQSEVTGLYNIKGIPLTYLLDPNGKIIGKNLRGKLLEDKLKEIFG
ncbi:MAG: TlpA disulfide reductase family protein [Bacteroidetes bacterium]|nr:TlpA disulfide reductase family protein [Bacteroidota bacterium]